MQGFATYTGLRNLATDAANADDKLWMNVIEAHDRRDITVQEVMALMVVRYGEEPSRATAYRHLERWRQRLAS